jgi:hypothetical protein
VPVTVVVKNGICLMPATVVVIDVINVLLISNFNISSMFVQNERFHVLLGALLVPDTET